MPQRVRWRPSKEEGTGLIVSDEGSQSEAFIPWQELHNELCSNLLPYLFADPHGYDFVLRDQFGKTDWLMWIVDAGGAKVCSAWFGVAPDNGWAWDGLVRFGEANDPSPVRQTYQRYSDGTYRRLPSLWRDLDHPKRTTSGASLLSEASGIRRHNDVWVEELQGDGTEPTRGWEDKDHLQQTPGEVEAEIVIDETLDQIRGRVGQDVKISTIHGTREARLLWLILTHIGKPLHHLEIARKCCSATTVEKIPADSTNVCVPDEVWRAVYQCYNCFGKFLDRLLERGLGKDLRWRILGPSKKKNYLVNRNDWSFCWIRDTDNPEESTLL